MLQGSIVGRSSEERGTAKAVSDIRVIIAVYHAMFRAGLRKLLEAEPGFMVIGEAQHGGDAATLSRRLRPDVLLLDMALWGSDGLDVLHFLADDRAPVPVVLLTASVSAARMSDALVFGAAGIVMSTAAADRLYRLHPIGCARSQMAGPGPRGTTRRGVCPLVRVKEIRLGDRMA